MRALKKLGHDISVARRKRRISVQTMADRAMVGRNTITRVEKGDPGVSMGIYATALFVLGLTENLLQIADPASDPLSRTLEDDYLPKRVA